MKKLVTGSNGLAHFDNQVAAAAWIISDGPDHYSKAYVLMSNVNRVTLHRSKLEGIYRCFKEVEHRGIEANQMTHWCNNEAAVTSTNNPPENSTALI